MLFAPGERFAYCNSGYILLGAIIEKASGQTYEQFIQQRIFDPLSMTHSYYDSPLRVIPRRAAGYDKGPESYTNAPYLSMTQPYAAGSLASTVDDLALWDAALYTEQLLKFETLQPAFASYHLTDGTATDYGYGWGTSKLAGHPSAGHGGGINGFGSIGIRLPEERVYVAVLSNNTGHHPAQLGLELAAWAIGQPFHEPTPIELAADVLAPFAGDYHSDVIGDWHVECDNNRLWVQSGQGPRMELVAFSPAEFFIKSRSLDHLAFMRDVNGAVTAFELRGPLGMPVMAAKVRQGRLTPAWCDMPSIPTESQVSAGGVAFRRQGGQIEAALISVGEPERWQLPKGVVRKGETTQAAALREVREETGLETELVELIEQIEYWYYGGGRQGQRVRIHKHVHFYLLCCLGGSLADHDYEVNEARWFEIGQAVAQLAFESEKKVARKAAEIIAAMD